MARLACRAAVLDCLLRHQHMVCLHAGRRVRGTSSCSSGKHCQGTDAPGRAPVNLQASLQEVHAAKSLLDQQLQVIHCNID